MPNDGKERSEAAAIEWIAENDLPESDVSGLAYQAFLAGHAHATAQVRAVVEAARRMTAILQSHVNVADTFRVLGEFAAAGAVLRNALDALEREDKP